GRRERTCIVRIAQMHGLPDFARHRVDGREVAFVPFRGLEGAAVPASLLAVLGRVERDVLAIGTGRDVHELCPRTVGRRPEVVAARMARTSMLRLARGLIGKT